MNNTTEIISSGKLMTVILSDKMLAETSSDYIIPEDTSDSEKILMTDSLVTISNIEAGEKYIEINGKICFDVLLMGEDGALYGVTYADDFKSSITNDKITKNCQITLSNMVTNVNSKLINPRKINLTSSIVFDITVCDQIDTQIKIAGAEDLNDEVGIQRKQLNIMTMKNKGTTVENIPVSYDIELDANTPPISKMIYRHLSLTPFEIKGRNDSLELRNQANVRMIYLTEEGNIFSVEKSFMVDKSIILSDCEGYEWNANVSYNNLSVEIAQNSYGEMKIVEIDFDYDAALYGTKNISVCATSDIYSTEFECNTSSEHIHVCSSKRSLSCSLSVNSSISREEIGASAIRNVLMANAEVVESEIKYQDDKNKLILTGTAQIEIVCENACLTDEDKKYSSYVYTYPLKCEFDSSEYSHKDKYTHNIGITDIKYRADSSKLYCDFEALIKISLYDDSEYDIITNTLLNKEEAHTRISMPFTLCYPCGKETLWDIAKYYKITQESIISSNALNGDDITGKKVLLIPQFSKKDAILSKVI